MPVCLWNTSQLALTVNAGKTTFPKLGSGGGGGGETAVKMVRWHACGAVLGMVGLMIGLGRRWQPFMGLSHWDLNEHLSVNGCHWPQ